MPSNTPKNTNPAWGAIHENETLMLAITLTAASNMLNDRDDPHSMAVNLILGSAIKQLEAHLTQASIKLRRKEIRV